MPGIVKGGGAEVLLLLIERNTPPQKNQEQITHSLDELVTTVKSMKESPSPVSSSSRKFRSVTLETLFHPLWRLFSSHFMMIPYYIYKLLELREKMVIFGFQNPNSDEIGVRNISPVDW